MILVQMMVYTASPFLGPELGPIIGGFINFHTDWRWTFWVLVIWSAVQWILIVVFVPETYGPALLRRKAVDLRKRTGDDRVSLSRAPGSCMLSNEATTVEGSDRSDGPHRHEDCDVVLYSTVSASVLRADVFEFMPALGVIVGRIVR